MSPRPLMFEFSRPFVAFVLILVTFLQFAFKIRDVKIENRESLCPCVRHPHLPSPMAFWPSTIVLILTIVQPIQKA